MMTIILAFEATVMKKPQEASGSLGNNLLLLLLMLLLQLLLLFAVAFADTFRNSMQAEP